MKVEKLANNQFKSIPFVVSLAASLTLGLAYAYSVSSSGTALSAAHIEPLSNQDFLQQLDCPNQYTNSANNIEIEQNANNSDEATKLITQVQAFSGAETRLSNETQANSTLNDVLQFGLSEQQAEVFVEASTAELYQDLVVNPSLIPDVATKITQLPADSLTREYLLTLLKNIPDLTLARVINQLLAAGRAEDQLAAISLLASIEDSSLRAPISQSLVQQYHSMPHPAHKLSLLAHLDSNMVEKESLAADLTQLVQAEDTSLTLQAVAVVKKWLSDSKMMFTQQQRQQIKSIVEDIANDSTSPAKLRLESLDILELLG
ncbi:hypothetical protein [Catenovulum agarivorans]|uniref:hypothetical protein n=1 Tax=Catenovulum agarivorans TaxID=1172192 RepID=UPI0002FB6830|nr:hypothetical protein [Catenovulum agarivorans]